MKATTSAALTATGTETKQGSAGSARLFWRFSLIPYPPATRLRYGEKKRNSDTFLIDKSRESVYLWQVISVAGTGLRKFRPGSGRIGLFHR
ncbi:MAG: hypothetical protein D6800_14720 [Candidatus Zixiibacteriota bacterium]|nr:MAG: hypothetical protein D6800_14720 [candidate division Zixibacteria bacterium]